VDRPRLLRRARNLHRAAGIIRDISTAEFPKTFAGAASLPGSTFDRAPFRDQSAGSDFPILDGNVKRVLARYFGVEGSTAEKSVVDRCGSCRMRATPDQLVDVYTQAIMDMGATVCTRHKPLCRVLPLSADCRQCDRAAK